MEIPLLEADSVLTLELKDFPTDPSDLLKLLEDEKCAPQHWLAVARVYMRLNSLPAAEQVAHTAIAKLPQETHAMFYAVLCMAQIFAPKPDLKAALDICEKVKGDPLYAPLTNACVLYANQKYAEAALTLENAVKSRASGDSKQLKLFSLMAQARSNYTRKNYRLALKNYQTAIRMGVKLIGRSDPRVGAGTCYWQLGDLDHAKVAFKRSLEICEGNEQAPALCLLGLWHLNAAFHGARGEFESEYIKALTLLQKAFHAGQRVLPAIKIAAHLFSKHQMPEVMRLAQLAIDESGLPQQKAEAHFLVARAAHYDNNLSLAREHYSLACEFDPAFLAALLGKGSVEWLLDLRADAVHTFERAAKIHPKSCDALLYSGLFTFLAGQKAAACNTLEQYVQLSKSQNRQVFTAVLVALTEIYESRQDFSKALSNLTAACSLTSTPPPSWKVNLGALAFALGDFTRAQNIYEELDPTDRNLYNKARCLEAISPPQARELYEQMDFLYAKCRLALLNQDTNLSEQILASNPRNLDVRTLHAHLLHAHHESEREQQMYKDTISQDKHDTYTLVAMGNVYLSNAQNLSRSDSNRSRYLTRSADFFAKALQTDPLSSYAAQGLAIVLNLVGLSDKSLTLFSKLRDSIPEFQTLVNCALVMHESKDYTRACEVFTLAVNIDRQPQVLMLLARSLALRSNNPDTLLQALTLVEESVANQQNEESSMNLGVVQVQFASAVAAQPPKSLSIATLDRALEAATKASTTLADTKLGSRADLLVTKLETARNELDEMFKSAEQRKIQAQQLREAEIKERAARDEKLRAEEAQREAQLAEERAKLAEQAEAWKQEQQEQQNQRDKQRDDEKRKSKKPKNDQDFRNDESSDEEARNSQSDNEEKDDLFGDDGSADEQNQQPEQGQNQQDQEPQQEEAEPEEPEEPERRSRKKTVDDDDD